MVRLFTGFEAYLVGGCVRDLLLNRPPKDFNVITIRSPALRRWRKILKKKKNFSYLKCLEAVTSLTLISGKTLCNVTSLLTGILSTNISTCSCVIHRGLWIMMEIDYMLSYGATESSLRLLHIFHILKILLPIQKLFSHMDEFVSCDQPSTCYGLDFCAQGKQENTKWFMMRRFVTSNWVFISKALVLNTMLGQLLILYFCVLQYVYQRH
ncbi:putative polynucleotide adenylyltransferase [Helianthus annuus]|nr:putative polynucleotide adenylyltransferase [Helianthus annuus]